MRFFDRLRSVFHTTYSDYRYVVPVYREDGTERKEYEVGRLTSRRIFGRVIETFSVNSGNGDIYLKTNSTGFMEHVLHNMAQHLDGIPPLSRARRHSFHDEDAQAASQIVSQKLGDPKGLRIRKLV